MNVNYNLIPLSELESIFKNCRTIISKDGKYKEKNIFDFTKYAKYPLKKLEITLIENFSNIINRKVIVKYKKEIVLETELEYTGHCHAKASKLYRKVSDLNKNGKKAFIVEDGAMGSHFIVETHKDGEWKEKITQINKKCEDYFKSINY